MRKMLVVTVAVCTLLYACDIDSPPRVNFDLEALHQARNKWEAQGISSYTFEVFEFWAGPQPIFRITVTEGEIADIEVVDDKHENEENIAYALERIRALGTIPAIFDDIEILYEEALRKLPQLEKQARITCQVKYNEAYGFPEEVRYSVSFVDGGFYSITVRNFRHLQAAK